MTTCRKDTANHLQRPFFPSSAVTGPGPWLSAATRLSASLAARCSQGLSPCPELRTWLVSGMPTNWLYPGCHPGQEALGLTLEMVGPKFCLPSSRPQYTKEKYMPILTKPLFLQFFVRHSQMLILTILPFPTYIQWWRMSPPWNAEGGDMEEYYFRFQSLTIPFFPERDL